MRKFFRTRAMVLVEIAALTTDGFHGFQIHCVFPAAATAPGIWHLAQPAQAILWVINLPLPQCQLDKVRTGGKAAARVTALASVSYTHLRAHET